MVLAGDHHRIWVHSSDIAVVIKRDIGDSDTISIFNGIKYGKTNILMKEAFVLGKYNFIRAIGLMLGCTNEVESSKVQKKLCKTRLKMLFSA